VALDRDERPDSFDDPERPRASEKAIDARQCTPDREGEHEPLAAPLQRIHHHHERHDARAEQRQHYLALIAADTLR
jgi:hypothetical protein